MEAIDYRDTGNLTACLTFASGDYTGASRIGASVAKGLLDRGHRVIAVCGLRPPNNQPAVADVLTKMGASVHEVGEVVYTLNWSLITRFRQIYRNENVDCVVTFFATADTRHAGLAASVMGIPLIASVQIEIKFFGGRLLRKIKELGFGYIYRRCVTRALCTSQPIQEELVEKYRMRPDRVEVLPNGIDTSLAVQLKKQEREDVRKEFGVRNDEILMVNVGRLDPQKGQRYLIEAVKLIKQNGLLPRVLLIGDCTPRHQVSVDYASQLRRSVEESEIASMVSFLGWRNDVLRICAASDCYVHAALWEGPALPLSVIEAMSCGRPVVVTDCMGWPPGFVDSKHGFVVPSGQSSELARAMTKLVQMSPADREVMGNAARDLARTHYDIKQLQRRFIEVCESLVLANRSQN